jgi:hypothetical protein
MVYPFALCLRCVFVLLVLPCKFDVLSDTGCVRLVYEEPGDGIRLGSVWLRYILRICITTINHDSLCCRQLSMYLYIHV